MRYLLAFLALCWFAVLGFAQVKQEVVPEGDVVGVHDPSIIKEGNTYYVFATGRAPKGGQLPIRCSEDLRHWRLCGQVFAEMPAWIAKRSPRTRDLWAPDVSFSHGQYRLYYAYSVFGLNTSGIALAANRTLDPKSPDYRWVDQGLILESEASDNFNAIDPNYSEDAQGRAWLSFGSFWSGIKMRALDAATGQLSTADTTLYPLAARGRVASAAQSGAATAAPDALSTLPPDSQAIEAPFVVRHGDFFYLFVSYDLCCRGSKSTYRTMVGRSVRITGPYTDRQGRPMLDGGASQVLFNSAGWVGPGGESVLHDPGRGDLIVFHAYDALTGKPALHFAPIRWTEGWPSAALADGGAPDAPR